MEALTGDCRTGVARQARHILDPATLSTMDISALLAANLPLPLPVIIAGAAVIMIGGGAIAAVIRGRGHASPEEWAHGAYSIWTGGEDCGEWGQSEARSALRNWYSVESGQGFWNVINGLRRGTTQSVAWDRVRAIDLLRIGYAADYINNDQCWQGVTSIASELTEAYDSWEALARDFESGMHTWQDQRQISDASQRDRVQRNLPYLRKTAWPKVKFTATLDD